MAKNKCTVCGAPCLKETCMRHTNYKNKKKEKMDTFKGQYESMDDFFEEIWKERPHYCFESGKWLGSKWNRNFFHHILHKGTYPQFAYCKWNVILLSQDIHTMCHSNLSQFPKIKEITEELKETRV